MTKAFILDFLADHKQEFHDKYGVTKIGLFGSYARDEQREDSDIDIAIEMQQEKKNIRTFFGLKREMETIFGKKIDIGIESTLKPIVIQYIMNEIIYV